MQQICPADVEDLLVLNNTHTVELSALTARRFQSLLTTAFYSCCNTDKTGFILCFDQDSDYDSFNFLWFKARYTRFVYVDRVVVWPEARGKGIAKAFYEGLFERAAAAGYNLITCEVNSNPPNPGSDAFHRHMGFVEVGQAVLEQAGKSVRYLAKSIECQI